MWENICLQNEIEGYIVTEKNWIFYVKMSKEAKFCFFPCHKVVFVEVILFE